MMKELAQLAADTDILVNLIDEINAEYEAMLDAVDAPKQPEDMTRDDIESVCADQDYVHFIMVGISWMQRMVEQLASTDPVDEEMLESINVSCKTIIAAASRKIAVMLNQEEMNEDDDDSEEVDNIISIFRKILGEE